MRSVIDSIYDGDINPAEDILSYNDELRRMYAQSAEMLTVIRNQLSDEQKTMLDDYAELKNRICDEAARTGFRIGLSMGIKLITESFSYVRNLTEETE